MRLDVRSRDRAQRAQDLDLFVTHRSRIEIGRGLHRHQRKQLQHVVLHHVPERAGAVVIIAAALDPDGLGDRNLDVVDMRTVPQRFEQQVGEAQREQVLDRLLAQIMVDPERPLLGEGERNRVVDLAARLKIGPERLFERHPHGRAGEPGRLETVDGRLEQRRRGRQKDRNPVARIADRAGKPREAVLVGDVERHIVKPL